ncbi:MAG: 3-deoxy-manno-octulosonate cytidylyltransferase [Chthoniobacterales bacterium]|nr:3-deoxy-manno-octulosonate cytidylyltransferase [Chthoniobacterales bacterium]
MMDSDFSAVVIIPARWGSTRFPGKMLHEMAGRPLIEHVWQRCRQARLVERILIATDDKRIQGVAEDFGAEVLMTSPHHQSGTDRIAEVVELLEKDHEAPQASHIINVQGDEPLLDFKLIDRLAESLQSLPELEIITAATPLIQASDHHDPNMVKVVLNHKADALYFSRAPIPFHRDPMETESKLVPLIHLGIYGFRKDILKRFVTYPPSPLECSEKLEQLRALENGISIRVMITQHHSRGIDTLADAKAVEAHLPTSYSF